jgi:hypothetical protein
MRNHIGKHLLWALRYFYVVYSQSLWMVWHTTNSSCLYHYFKIMYGSTKFVSKASPCTNVPVHCPICPFTSLGQQKTFWKYNALWHLASEHAAPDNDTYIVPPEFYVLTFITTREETYMDVPQGDTDVYRYMNVLPDTDGLEEIEDVIEQSTEKKQKGGRAPSHVASQPLRKVIKST